MNKLSYADGTDQMFLEKILDNKSLIEELLGLFISVILSNPKMLFDIKKYTIRVFKFLKLDFRYFSARYASL